MKEQYFSKKEEKKLIHNYCDKSEVAGQIVEDWLDRGIINTRSNKGSTPLMLAIEHKNNEFIRMLLNYNADVTLMSTKDASQGETVLHQAARSIKETKTLELIIKKCSEAGILNNKNYYGQTAIFLGVMKNNLKFVSEILKYDIDLKAQDAEGSTILHTLYSLKSFELRKVIVEKAKELDILDVKKLQLKKDSAVSVATRYEDVHLIELLIKNGASCTIDLDKCTINGYKIKSNYFFHLFPQMEIELREVSGMSGDEESE